MGEGKRKPAEQTVGLVMRRRADDENDYAGHVSPTHRLTR